MDFVTKSKIFVVCSAPEKLEADDDSMYRFGLSSDLWSMGVALLQLVLTGGCQCVSFCS